MQLQGAQRPRHITECGISADGMYNGKRSLVHDFSKKLVSRAVSSPHGTLEAARRFRQPGQFACPLRRPGGEELFHLFEGIARILTEFAYHWRYLKLMVILPQVVQDPPMCIRKLRHILLHGIGTSDIFTPVFGMRQKAVIVQFDILSSNLQKMHYIPQQQAAYLSQHHTENIRQ